MAMFYHLHGPYRSHVWVMNTWNVSRRVGGLNVSFHFISINFDLNGHMCLLSYLLNYATKQQHSRKKWEAHYVRTYSFLSSANCQQILQTKWHDLSTYYSQKLYQVSFIKKLNEVIGLDITENTRFEPSLCNSNTLMLPLQHAAFSYMSST